MKRSLAIVAALSIAFSLSACGDSASEGSTDSTANSSASNSASGAPTEGLSGAYGSPVEWEDGTTVEISEPESFIIASDSAKERYPGETIHAVVTIHNGADEPLDLSVVSISATSSGKGAKRIDTQMMGQPVDEIAAGEDITFDVGFEVQDPESVVIRVDRNTGSDEAAYFRK